MIHQLSGRCIWITRPASQAAELCGLLQAAQARVTLLPLLEIAPPSDPSALRQALSRLDHYDLALFVSPSALDAVFAELDTPWPAHLPVGVMGPGSARRARQLGLRQLIQPATRFDSAGLLQESELQHLGGKRVALFRGSGGRNLLPDTLRQRGAQVDCIAAYRRLPPAFDEAHLASELAAGCDAVVITSSEAAQHLFRLAGDKTRQQLQSLLYFAPHPRIVDTLTGLGATSVRLTGSGDARIAAAVIHHFAPDSGPGTQREEQQNVG